MILFYIIVYIWRSIVLVVIHHDIMGMGWVFHNMCAYWRLRSVRIRHILVGPVVEVWRVVHRMLLRLCVVRK